MERSSTVFVGAMRAHERAHRRFRTDPSQGEGDRRASGGAVDAASSARLCPGEESKVVRGGDEVDVAMSALQAPRCGSSSTATRRFADEPFALRSSSVGLAHFRIAPLGVALADLRLEGMECQSAGLSARGARAALGGEWACIAGDLGPPEDGVVRTVPLRPVPCGRGALDAGGAAGDLALEVDVELLLAEGLAGVCGRWRWSEQIDVVHDAEVVSQRGRGVSDFPCTGPARQFIRAVAPRSRSRTG